MNYEMDVTPDESALDVEWLEQPALTLKYGMNCAKARDALDRCKEKLELVKAELDASIRKHPERRDIQKLTEAVVQNAIITDTYYQDTMEEYLQAKNEYEIARVALSAVEAKKAALENLVRLHGMNYFAGPAVPRDLTKEWASQERIKKADEGVKRAMRRK